MKNWTRALEFLQIEFCYKMIFLNLCSNEYFFYNISKIKLSLFIDFFKAFYPYLLLFSIFCFLRVRTKLWGVWHLLRKRCCLYVHVEKVSVNRIVSVDKIVTTTFLFLKLYFRKIMSEGWLIEEWATAVSRF